MRTAFIRTFTELAARDPRLMLVVGDLGFGVVLDFAQRFPRQFVNAGISEQNMMGLAAGLAMSGKTVFVYSIANFPTLRCLEQIRNDVCYHNASVKIVAVGCGFAYGALGPSHHATEDLAVMRVLPRMTVVAPGDPAETDWAVRAVAEQPGPCYLRLGRAGEAAVHPGPIPFRLGRAVTVRRGTDLTLVASGGMLPVAVGAADRLARKRISARVLSMHTLKPLDDAAVLAAARETGVVVTLEEHSTLGGLGGAVAEVLAEACLDGLVFKRLGLPSAFSKAVGDQRYLRQIEGLGEEEIVRTVSELYRVRRVRRDRAERGYHELEGEVRKLPAALPADGIGRPGNGAAGAHSR